MQTYSRKFPRFTVGTTMLNDKDELKSIATWLNSLPEHQLREFAELEEAWSHGFCTNGINKDWIEDHGGDRRWWAVLYGTVQS